MAGIKVWRPYIHIHFFLLAYEELWRVPQTDWFLIIELHHLISKNQKLNFFVNDIYFLGYKSSYTYQNWCNYFIWINQLLCQPDYFFPHFLCIVAHLSCLYFAILFFSIHFCDNTWQGCHSQNEKSSAAWSDPSLCLLSLQIESKCMSSMIPQRTNENTKGWINVFGEEETCDLFNKIP